MATTDNRPSAMILHSSKSKVSHNSFKLASNQIKMYCHRHELSLPPEGTVAVYQGRSDGQKLPPGTQVEVRPLRPDLTFGDWKEGTVVEHMWQTSVTGNKLEMYSVEMDGGEIIGEYAPCMGELRDGRLFKPLDTFDRPLNELRVFAFTSFLNMRRGPGVPIFTPAVLASAMFSEDIMVMPLSQKELKINPNPISARYVLPYNEETAVAIREQGWKIEPEEWHKDFARWYVIAEILHRDPMF